MNKVLKGLVAVAATAAMAVAGFAGASTAMAAENNYDITVPTTDTHTYSVILLLCSCCKRNAAQMAGDVGDRGYSVF